MQHVRAEARTAHACIRHAHDVVNARFEQFGRNWQVTPLWETRAAVRSGVLENQHGVLVHVQIVVDGRSQRFVPLEYKGLAPMPEQALRCRSLLDHRAVRREVAAEDCRAALGMQRIIQGPDQVPVANLDTRHVLGDSSAAHGQRAAVEEWEQLLHHARQPAGVEEILHEILPGWLDVRNVRRLPGDAVEILQHQGHSRPPGDR